MSRFHLLAEVPEGYRFGLLALTRGVMGVAMPDDDNTRRALVLTKAGLWRELREVPDFYDPSVLWTTKETTR